MNILSPKTKNFCSGICPQTEVTIPASFLRQFQADLTVSAISWFPDSMLLCSAVRAVN